MNDPLMQALEEFMDAAEARIKAMRSEIRNELLVELRSAPIEKHVPVVGEKGDPGERGEPGPAGPEGPQGEKGADGRDGKDGVGIEDAKIDGGELMLVLSDGTVKNLGRVVGPKGERGDPGLNGKDGRDGIDGKDGAPGEPGPRGPAGAMGEKGERGPEGAPGRDGRDGAPGVRGEKGEPGLNGKDGRDGITPDQLDAAVQKAVADTLASIQFDGRTWKIGERTVDTPAPRYRDVWREGEEYGPGDMVTWAGSLWHANAVTNSKPGSGDEWTLAVKRGRDGRSAG